MFALFEMRPVGQLRWGPQDANFRVPPLSCLKYAFQEKFVSTYA